jgi:hypothetical protein
MSTWAYPCRPCTGDGEWFVARERVAEWPAAVVILRVKVGDDWRCATVDRNRPLAVDASLVREAVPSDAQDCPGCAPRPAAAPAAAAAAPVVAETESSGTPLEVHAAAIALQGRRFVVVLVPLEVVRSPGEADMLAADLGARFGGVDMVLMGQTEDGTPEYHGDAALQALLADVPVDRMPWKVYPLK